MPDPSLRPRTKHKRTLASQRSHSPVPSVSTDLDSTPLPGDDRRKVANRKRRLQRDLLQAAPRGDYYDISILLSEGVDMDWTEQNEGKTALHFAAQYGHLRAVERLLEARADIEARSDAFGDDLVNRTEMGRTPLLWAAAGRDCHCTQERMCSLLLEKGADPNARYVMIGEESFRNVLRNILELIHSDRVPDLLMKRPWNSFANVKECC